jgi:hypothetical protein
METDHLEGKGLSPEVGLIPKGDGRVDLSEGFGLFPQNDTVERHPGRSDARPVDAHGVKHLNVHDVEAATYIHQHFTEMLLVNDWINNKWVSTQMRKVVGAVKGDGGP